MRGFEDNTNEIVLVSVADGAVRSLKKLDWRDPSRVSLSPDGRYLAYDLAAGESVPARDIFLLPLDGGRERTVVQHGANDFQPLWSPDGSRLLFLSDRTGTDALWAVRMAADGTPQGQAELLAPDVGRDPMGITRNGSLLYMIRGGGRNVHLAEVGADMKLKGAPTMLSERFINTNSSPVWSLDGQYIAYYSARGSRDALGSTVLVIRSTKTGEERDIVLKLLATPVQQTALRWFPDGRSLIVVGRNPQRNGVAYYRVDVASGNLQLLREVNNAMGIARNQPQLSPTARSSYMRSETTTSCGSR